MKSTPEDFKILAESILEALQSDPSALNQAVSDFAAALNAHPPESLLLDLFEKLRNHTRFKELAGLADAVLDSGLNTPAIRRYYAQALIDLGCLEPALGQLERLLEQLEDSQRKELSEALGLTGRVHKQRFVRTQNDRRRAARELRSSIDCYFKAYPLDPAWHGANLVDLICRAEREGIAPGEGLRSEIMAQKVLQDLGEPSAQWNPWTHAAAAHCYLALEDWEKANLHFGSFITNPKVNAFQLNGEARQLKEIWEVSPGRDHPLSSILLALDAQQLTQAGGQVQYTPQELAHVSNQVQNIDDAAPGDRLEALLGDNRQVTLHTLISLLEITPAVCQIVDRDKYREQRKSGGTGFLIEGGKIAPEFDGQPLLITNAHVLSEDGRIPSVRRQSALAIFHFWGGQEETRQFPVREILWSSPFTRLDAVVALLDELDPASQPACCSPNSDSQPLTRPNPDPHTPKEKVYVIGHPEGRGLEFSLSDNEIIDHDLDADPDAAPGFRRIHYRAPTEKGSSGSPVLDERNYQVLGLHRAGGRIDPLHQPPPVADYQANEAVWFQSIILSFRNRAQGR